MDLPNEIILKIIEYVDPIYLINLYETSKRLGCLCRYSKKYHKIQYDKIIDILHMQKYIKFGEFHVNKYEHQNKWEMLSHNNKMFGKYFKYNNYLQYKQY